MILYLSAAGSVDGRIGHSGNVGLQSHPLDTVPGDSLAVVGSNNFQSVRASHAVFRGLLTLSVFSLFNEWNFILYKQVFLK